MHAIVIHDLPSFRVVSHGHGMAYTFHHKPSAREVWFQGEDAIHFEEALDSYERHQPMRSYESIFEALWGEYSIISEPA